MDEKHESGGCECLTCGRIFIGGPMDTACGVCKAFNLTNECQHLGSERLFIPYNPTSDKLSPVEETPRGDK
jgi:hypothetical protein